MDSQASLSQDSLVPTTELPQPATPKYRSVSRSDSPGPAHAPRPHSPDRVKFTSPPPPTTSSMTPPPSSQLPSARAVARTPTPTTPQLTSPPPSARLSNQPSALTEAATVFYSPDQISNASADELRSMVDDLTCALRDMRLSAAHYKLQYNMAAMESQESASRMAVELAMAQREIDVLQQAEAKRREHDVSPSHSFQESPVNTTNAVLMSEMNRQSQVLQNENEELRDLLDQQKRITEHREGELASAMEENDRLKARIRKNREHMALYMDQMNDHNSPRSLFGTPYQSTPRRHANRVPPALSGENGRGQNNFDALLLADKMLSQETATAPSTPTRSHAPRSKFTHNRGTHSMSSLPHTPNRRSHYLRPDQPRTPPVFTAVNIPQSAPPAHYTQQPIHARRESSNSTITASSVDEEEAFTEREDEDVPESQASQAATSMLRRAAQPRQRAATSANSSQLVQSKLFGQVKKAGALSRPGEMEKRRLQSAEHHGSPTKRGRVDHGVGLGIGGLLRD